jgi:hypothetical protein
LCLLSLLREGINNDDGRAHNKSAPHYITPTWLVHLYVGGSISLSRSLADSRAVTPQSRICAFSLGANSDPPRRRLIPTDLWLGAHSLLHANQLSRLLCVCVLSNKNTQTHAQLGFCLFILDYPPPPLHYSFADTDAPSKIHMLNANFLQSIC